MPYASDDQRRFMHARHPEIADRWDAEIREKRKHQPSFGNGGKGHGRRQKDEPAKEKVGKSRFYDPESRRQRRLGAAQAALAGGAVVGTTLGVRGAAKTTKLVRGKHPNILASPKERAALLQRLGGAVSAQPRDLALLGGGTASGGGAVALHRHAESRRGHPYN
jgi:hypothetical protein